MFESLKGYLPVLTHISEPDIKADNDSSNLPLNTENPKDFTTFSIEATLKDRLNQAKHWSTQVYEKAIKSSETSTQFLTSHVQQQLAGMDLKSVIKKVPLLREFEQSQSDFEAEQRAKNPDLNETNNQADSTCLPWHPDSCGLTDPAAVTDLRTRILALSQQPNTFLLQPPVEAQLDTSLSSEQWHLARLLLREDPNLDRMRYKLVPSRISEELFWRNYFYRINLLRQSAHLASVAGGNTPLSDTIHDPANFVYIEENYATEHTVVGNGENTGKEIQSPVDNATAQKSNDKPLIKTKRNKSGKPVVSNDASANNRPPSKSTSNDVKQIQQDSAGRMQSVDELLDAELAREVDELVLVDQNDPLTDQLDRELEMELLAEMDQMKN